MPRPGSRARRLRLLGVHVRKRDVREGPRPAALPCPVERERERDTERAGRGGHAHTPQKDRRGRGGRCPSSASAKALRLGSEAVSCNRAIAAIAAIASERERDSVSAEPSRTQNELGLWSPAAGPDLLSQDRAGSGGQWRRDRTSRCW